MERVLRSALSAQPVSKLPYFGRKLRRGSAGCLSSSCRIVDVMLVLLVILIVTIPIQTHSVKLDLPNGGPPPINAPAIDLEIDFDGTPIWNGTPVPSRTQLDGYFIAAAAQIPQPE